MYRIMDIATTTDRPPLPLLFQLLSPNNNNHYSGGGGTAKYMPMFATAGATMIEDSSAALQAESVELRSRSSKATTYTSAATTTSNGDPWRHESPATTGSGSRIPLTEHVVKKGETLMQISLQYSVPVSEIKRVNNIVADQEIHGLPVIRIPVTRAYLLRRQMMEAAAEAEGAREGQIIDLLSEEGTSKSNGGIDLKQGSSKDFNRVSNNHQHSNKELGIVTLLDNQRDAHSSSESLTGRAREAIEGILDETDRNMAAVRQNLPSPSLEGGAFHFVDAGAPDHSSNVWLIVSIVLIIFVLLPLALTFLEETGEMEEHQQQQPQQ